MFEIYLYCVHLSILPMYMTVSTCIYFLEMLEEGIRSTEIGVTDGS